MVSVLAASASAACGEGFIAASSGFGKVPSADDNESSIQAFRQTTDAGGVQQQQRNDNSHSSGGASAKSKRKSKKKSKKKMFDEEVDRYATYEDYLDSLVSEEDYFYLEDEEMARIIAELGYRSSGDTLSRENFYKMKTRLAEKRLLTGGGDGDSVLESTFGAKAPSKSLDNPVGQGETEESILVRELRRRAKEINSGDLQTVIFMQTGVARKASSKLEKPQPGHLSLTHTTTNPLEVSGHIDLGHRLRSENFVPFLTGERRLVPKAGDLTFYNWARGRAQLQSTKNFEVVISGSNNLVLRHRNSGVEIDGAQVGQQQQQQQQLSKAEEKFLAQGFKASPWKKVAVADEFGTTAYFYDIRVVK